MIPKGGENKLLYVEELLKDEITLFGKGKACALIEATVREMKNGVGSVENPKEEVKNEGR